MELKVARSDVISRYSLYDKVVGNLHFVAVCHHLSEAKHVGTSLVGYELRLFVRQLLDCIRVEMVAMLVSEEDIVGLWHGGIVYGFTTLPRNGVDLDLLPIVFNPYAGMHQGMKLKGFAALSLKSINLVKIIGDGFSILLPCQDTPFEVNTLKTFLD